MGIGKIQFDAIMREYDNTRAENEYSKQKKYDEICEKFPEYESLDKMIPEIATAAIHKLLAGDIKGSTELKNQIKEIAQKKEKILKDNGYPADYVDIKYICCKCKDTGYADGNKCSCLKNKIIDILYEQSKLKEKLQVENFHTLSEEFYSGPNLEYFRRAVAICKDMIAEYPEKALNILFRGKVGTGKSFLSCCIAKEFLDLGYSVLYMSSTELFDTLGRQRFDRDREKMDMEYDDTIYMCDLLVIDDLGTELSNSFIRSALFELVNRRIRDKKCTIISTNLTLNEICDTYSERIVSRIISNYKVCNIVSDNDIRLEKRKKIIGYE